MYCGAFRSNFLLPIPTLFYCLHNYNLMSSVANQSQAKCAHKARNVVVYTLCIALVAAAAMFGYYLDTRIVVYVA